jgi:hypothetical protein
MVGHPVSRLLQKKEPRTVEITRTCTLGDSNANSRIYGALCRAAQALGYTSAITYTLESESGASLKAAGFHIEAVVPHEETHRAGLYPVDLFGESRRPIEAKFRWRRFFGGHR